MNSIIPVVTTDVFVTYDDVFQPSRYHISFYNYHDAIYCCGCIWRQASFDKNIVRSDVQGSELGGH